MPSCGRTSSTGIGSVRTNSSATEPSQKRPRGPRPCVVITTRSAWTQLRLARITSRTSPSATSCATPAVGSPLRRFATPSR